MTKTKLTWKDLKAQGVKRCSGIFTSGKQCRKRAVEGKDGHWSWCARHGKTMGDAMTFLHKPDSE